MICQFSSDVGYLPALQSLSSHVVVITKMASTVFVKKLHKYSEVLQLLVRNPFNKNKLRAGCRLTVDLTVDSLHWRRPVAWHVTRITQSANHSAAASEQHVSSLVVRRGARQRGETRRRAPPCRLSFELSHCHRTKRDTRKSTAVAGLHDTMEEKTPAY